MKKWIFRLLASAIFIIMFASLILSTLQPQRLDIVASADKQFNIFKEFGEEKQPLPYATLVYIEQNRGFVFNRSKALVFAGPEHTLLIPVNQTKALL
ncbi:hypothetical protein [Pseudoalteromonas sp. S16_S37]|uniref:hypothetical protein n=1 Tax=Pseudoalteromonas sp. S16_S37 TaxID=2720228 RepID=UPI0016806B1E|nr:hypothetical protein [Pseudoalteromonas sp. S16_S37]MBD1583851.1 hypothetical protein [Pseudoalteromonas sp. S16_S37]